MAYLCPPPLDLLDGVVGTGLSTGWTLSLPPPLTPICNQLSAPGGGVSITGVHNIFFSSDVNNNNAVGPYCPAAESAKANTRAP